jgi:branched-chain amino acid transport system substrate-binding protein
MKMVDAKRNWLLLCLGLVISIFCLTASTAPAAERPPIKVGFLLPYTGTMPLQAKGLDNGMELYFDEIGRKAGGRAIQVIKEDDENNPTVGLTKVRRLVEEHKVNFILGPVHSGVALAMHDYVCQQKLIWVNPNAFTRELSAPGKVCENTFRIIETTDQSNYPMGKWIYKNTPYRNMVMIGSDFSAGHHSLEAFRAGFEEAGGKVVKEVYAKLGTMDFAPFLSTIDVKGADATYAWFAGTDAVRFDQQYAEFGLKKKLPLFGHNVITDDPYLASIADAALGIITTGHYAYTLDTPRNRAFVKAYTVKYGEPPSRYSELGYSAANLVGAVLEVLKGEVGDIPRVAKELKSVSAQIEAPSGPLSFDKYNQRITNIYAFKVEKRDGKLANVVIGNMGKVAQEDVWKWWNK